MTSIRFLHTADLHIDTPFKGLGYLPETVLEKVKKSTFVSFQHIVSKAISENVDFVVIAGDLYDGANRSLTAQMFLKKEFQRLADYAIQVYAIHGNHDHLSGEWAQITWPGNVHYFSGEVPEMLPYKKEGKVLAHIYGYSYPKRAVTENISTQYAKVEGAPYHIALLHGTAGGSTEHANYAPFIVNELNRKPFDYWALGHIHKRTVLNQDPYIAYPGNIQGLNPKETGVKGCYLVELSDHNTTVDFVESAPSLWEELELQIDDITEIDQLIQRIQQGKEILRATGKNTIVTVKLLGSSEIIDLLIKGKTIEELIQLLQDGEDEENVFVWIHRIKLPKEGLQLAHVSESHFINEIVSVLETTDNLDEILEPLWKHRKAKKFLTEEELDEQEILEEARQLLLDSMIHT
ncbi:DNA repair exonuclease [Alkalihalobacillus sp. AL-G]|uniref:metallophosphoesterase family protein n=1 Tax=Alkalihalobacillus sp. AL-G TaxID=2926399 RepID=UPI00272DC599|nr:DNA repair exonuclease [Alkalihalobacillus sp. AL-G]WLD94064.1 DNA repair exonuclease [Alkalihalobacillus sp. AL-G]